MRLADFILGSIEAIIVEWEAFARSIWPKGGIAPLALRDHAEEILRAAAADMISRQTDTEQSEKSKGRGSARDRVNDASDIHGAARVLSGFDLVAMVSEYRALRASVIRLWRESGPDPDLRDLDDLTRFNESIDQSLAHAVRSYTDKVDRSRQMFLSILGHDLRNPLNSMMMSAEAQSQAAARGHVDAAESSETASHISASAAAMGRMISDLLDFTQRGVGAAMPLSRAPMELGRLCREVFDEIRAAHPTNLLRFEAQGNLTGEWDANRVRQVVSNLLGNAVQHGLENGPVDLTVSAEGVDENVVIVIHNWGPPIPPDVLPTIFDPLVRGSSPEAQKQRRPGSIGLGLYIAREVVIAHGGSIEVKSSKEDGTVFTVRLPRHRAPAAAAGPAPSEDSR